MVGRFNFPPICISTLWRYLDGELIMVKLPTIYNQQRNALETRLMRKNYAYFSLKHQENNYFFIDECGFSLNTTRRVAPPGNCSRSEEYRKNPLLLLVLTRILAWWRMIIRMEALTRVTSYFF